MTTTLLSVLLLVSLLCCEGYGPAAFIGNVGGKRAPTQLCAEVKCRRSFLQDSVMVGGLLLVGGEAAEASGGATAGGTYLLSAKQRYNERVKAGMKSFIALGSSLESGSVDTTKAFFASEEEGAWNDASAAGYLLSNAFRRNSTTPPDNLPAVKVRTIVAWSQCCSNSNE